MRSTRSSWSSVFLTTRVELTGLYIANAFALNTTPRAARKSFALEEPGIEEGGAGAVGSAAAPPTAALFASRKRLGETFHSRMYISSVAEPSGTMNTADG